MKKQIDLNELKKTTMIELSENQQQKVMSEISKLINDIKIFDDFNLVNVQPLENISNASFNFLRDDEIKNSIIDSKEVLKQHNKVIDDFGVLKNEK